MAVIDTYKFDEDPIKMKSLSYGQYFSIISLLEISAAMETGI